MDQLFCLEGRFFFLIPKIIEILDTNQKEAGLKRKWEAHNEIINILKNWKNGRKLKKTSSCSDHSHELSFWKDVYKKKLAQSKE